MSDRVPIRKLPSGVPGLDDVLGGGIPEFSFNLMAGGPGCGKTTFAHQIMFANATRAKGRAHFTVLGEPPIKMLRYQQQFHSSTPKRWRRCVRFIHLGKELIEGGMQKVLERIVAEVENVNPVSSSWTPSDPSCVTTRPLLAETWTFTASYNCSPFT